MGVNGKERPLQLSSIDRKDRIAYAPVHGLAMAKIITDVSEPAGACVAKRQSGCNATLSVCGH
jgi:hypothetical protein